MFATPSADLALYVERYWVVSWEYPQAYRQLIVPYPNVHLTFSGGSAVVQGVWTSHQIKVLEGQGSVFGVAFRPGCFRPYLGSPLSSISNRRVDARELFGPDLPDPVGKETVEQFLRAYPPPADPKLAEAADAVAIVRANPTMTRVSELADVVGLSVRQLQRLFADYVGVGPKWVIRRYRLHDVTERLAAGEHIDWAGIAADLGYADQAHFTRDFKDMFGESPTHYAARY
jgi:AraC-like DNA-binding protein